MLSGLLTGECVNSPSFYCMMLRGGDWSARTQHHSGYKSAQSQHVYMCWLWTGSTDRGTTIFINLLQTTPYYYVHKLAQMEGKS